MEIIINWASIDSEATFYESFLSQVDAPGWHGKNLDALADSVVTGDINEIEPPYTIHNIATASITESLAEFQLKVLNIFNEGVAASRGIKVVTE